MDLELSDILRVVSLGVAITLLALGIVVIDISIASTIPTNLYATSFGLTGLVILIIMLSGA